MKNKHKTLVISSWAPPMIGGPQDLYNLLSQFPTDSYIILTSYSAIKMSGQRRGNWLPGEYVFYDYRGPVEREKFRETQRSSAPPATLTWKQRLENFLQSRPYLKPFFMLFFSAWKIVAMTSTGVRTVRQNNASIILGISDHGPAMIAAYLVSRFTKRPYCLYLYDIYRGNNLYFTDRLLAAFFEKRLFQNAARVILTNEGTEVFYQRRYGKIFRSAVVHNSVFPKDYREKRTSYRLQPPYKIVFTGHVYWAQEQAVMNLIQAMRYLKGLPVRLNLYVPKPDERLKRLVGRYRNVTLSSAPPSEMPRIQGGASLLVLPLAWNTKSPGIIATATPGKFTGYLASGRPMLVHAPDYAYVAQYVKKHQLGLVVEQNDVSILAKTIRSFLTDPGQGQIFIKNSLAEFYRNHDAKKNAKKLMRLLVQASGLE